MESNNSGKAPNATLNTKPNNANPTLSKDAANMEKGVISYTAKKTNTPNPRKN